MSQRIQRSTWRLIALLVSMPTAVERLAESIRRTGPIVVAGYGTVGGKVVEMLRDARETTIVIDQQLLTGADIVGNVLEHLTLDRANVRAASAVVLALSNDSEGVFATAVVRDYAPEVPLIVRVKRVPNVGAAVPGGRRFRPVGGADGRGNPRLPSTRRAGGGRRAAH